MTSLWLDDAYVPRAPLEGDVTTDVAVIGGGIAGITTAYWLARSGARVVVIEARHLASAASGRNAGFLLAGIAENFVAASRRFGEERAWRVYEVTLRNRDLAKEVVARHAIECDLEWNGSLQIATDEEEWAEVWESAERVSARGVAVAVDEPTRSACYAEDGELHPVRFVGGLARAAEGLRAQIYEGTQATSVRADGVATGRGRVRCGAAVVCTNAYAPHLVRARIQPVRGQMLATAPVARRVFERPAYAHRGYRYWRQTRDGRVLVGGWRDIDADAEVGEEESLNATIQSALDGFLREHGIDAPVTHRWAGIMGFSHDGLPYAGRVTRNVFLCAGFTGHGNGFALALGELVAVLVRGESHPDADLLDPERP